MVIFPFVTGFLSRPHAGGVTNGCSLFYPEKSSIEEAQNYTKFLWTYNNKRSNMAVGGITSIQKLKKAT